MIIMWRNYLRTEMVYFMLIDRFSDDMRGMDLDHVGQISFATKAYMESATNQHVEPEPVETVQETDTELWYAQTENLYQFDKDGNIIYEEDVGKSTKYGDSWTRYCLTSISSLRTI